MSRLPAISFRARLLLLVLFAVLPALALVLYTADDEHSRARDDAKREGERIGQLQVAVVNRSIGNAQGALTALARAPEVVDSSSSCGEILNGAASQLGLLDIFVVAPDLSISCASLPVPDGASAGGLDSVGQVLSSNRFSLGGYHRDPLSRKGAADVALPVPDGSKRILVAEFDPASISAQTSLRDLPPNTSLHVVDRLGRVILLAPPGSATVGAPLREQALLDRVTGQHGVATFQSRGADGEERLYSLTPLEAGAASPYVIVGVPTAYIFHDADYARNRNLILLGLAAVLALGVVWAFGELFFMRRVRALVSGTRAVAAGNYGVQIPTGTNDELGTLARSFNDMTGELSVSIARVRDTEAELRALFAAMTDVILVVSREGVCLRVAPTNAAGGAPQHLVGLGLREVFPPEEAEAFAQLIQTSLNSDSTVHREYSIVDPEGRVRWFEPAISPLSADSVIWVARETTERREMLDQVAEREAQYRTIFESTGDGVTIVRLDGRRIEANPAVCRMHGYTYEEFMRVPSQEHIHPDDHPLRDRLVESIRKGEPYHLRARNVRKDGSVFDVDVRGTPISYHGEPHILAIMRDVTEEVAAERVLEQRVAERTHEIRTLLEVSRNVASTVELGPLLALILDQLRDVIPYGSAAVMQRHPAGLTVLASRGGEPGTEEVVSVGTTLELTSVGALDEGGVFEHPSMTADILGDDAHAVAFRQAAGPLLRHPRFRSIRSQIIVPLVGREGAIGALALSRSEVDAFTNDELNLASAFASQAAVAVENAALFAQREQRMVETESLARVSSSLTFARPLSETLNTVAAEIVASTNALAACVSVIVDGDFRAGGKANLPEEYFTMAAEGMASGAFSPSAVAARTLRSFRFEDARSRILQEPKWAPLHGYMRDAQWDGFVAIPLVNRGVGLGALEAYYRPGEMPSPHEQEFLRAIADQAAIAVENALLFDETRANAREQEALASVAGSLTYDRPLPELLDALAANVVSGTGAIASALVLLRPGGTEIEASGKSGLPEGYLEAAIKGWAQGGLAERMPLKPGEPIVIPNAREFLRANPAYAQVRGFLEETHWDTFVIVPLASRPGMLGALMVYLREGDEASAQRLRFLRAIADQATVAVENARLFDQVQSRTRQLQALYRADEDLHRSLVLDDVLRALLDVVIELLDAKYSSLILWEPDASRPTVLLGGAGIPPHVPEIIVNSLVRQGRSSSIARYAPLGEREVSAIEDLAATDDGSFPRDRTLGFGIRSLLEVPVVVGGELFAVLTAAYTAPRTFRDEERRGLVALARRAALAIENARLYEQAQALAAVEERQRLARELHDSVSQALYGIALGARTARTYLDRDPSRATEPMDYVLSLAEAGLAEMRALIFELRPESLEAEGLVAALDKQISATRARYNIAVDADLCPEPAIPLALKEALYRIAQEGLHNVVKHARARHVGLHLSCEAGMVWLDLEDDGAGFDTGGDFPGHLGLRSMRERAARLGGSLLIESAPGRGSHLHASIPIP